jgi:hypothetical protein
MFVPRTNSLKRVVESNHLGGVMKYILELEPKKKKNREREKLKLGFKSIVLYNLI